jgi:two-component system sensor histidine kinase KdpD
MKKLLKRTGLTIGILAAVSVLGVFLDRADFSETDIALAYCLAVIVIAWLTFSFIFSLIATGLATVTYYFIFTDPYYAFSVYDMNYITTFIALSLAALIASALTLQARRSALLVREKEEETEKERYRANLLRSISHDIRTPLSAVIGTAEMLEGLTGPDDKRMALIRGIRDEADWLRSLVENILNLTRLQDGPASLRKQPEAAEEVVGSAIRHITQRLPRHTITVDMPEELLMAPMDGKLVEQVLINLLDNAAGHTPPEKSITVTVKGEPGAVRFLVADEGEGIAEEHLPKIFESFYTTRENHADAAHGMGLGLAICRTIVRAHGGEITARRNPNGGGSVFEFTIPTEEGDHKK